MRRNTFPAVMLSCAYLLSNKGAKPDDVVAFLPVDPYTTVEFFNKIKSLGEYIEKQDSVIGLLGGVPTIHPQNMDISFLKKRIRAFVSKRIP